MLKTHKGVNTSNCNWQWYCGTEHHKMVWVKSLSRNHLYIQERLVESKAIQLHQEWEQSMNGWYISF